MSERNANVSVIAPVSPFLWQVSEMLEVPRCALTGRVHLLGRLEPEHGTEEPEKRRGRRNSFARAQHFDGSKMSQTRTAPASADSSGTAVRSVQVRLGPSPSMPRNRRIMT
eukprot:2669797-Rhodomonas_salina.1